MNALAASAVFLVMLTAITSVTTLVSVAQTSVAQTSVAQTDTRKVGVVSNTTQVHKKPTNIALAINVHTAMGSHEAVPFGVSALSTAHSAVIVHSSEQHNVSNFTAIEIDGAGLLIEITCQQQPNVQIVGEKSGAPRTINTEIDEGTLYITGTPTNSRVVVKVSVPKLEQLEINGAQVVKLYNLASPELSVQIDGASTLEAFGKVRKLNLEVAGAGMVNLKELSVESLFVECAGAAKAVTTVEKQIHATATGVSKILYYGKPSSVKKESCGLAVIKGMTP